MDSTVTVTKYPGNWSPVTQKRVSIGEACHWFTRHGYHAVRAFTVDGRRYIEYRKHNCKTEYQMVCKL